MKEEYEFSYKALAFLISGDESERKSILQGVKPEYFPEPCFGDILTAVSKMTEESKPVDLLTVLSELVSDSDSDALHKRLDNFRVFFEKTGELRAGSDSDETRRHIASFLAFISSSLSYSLPPENAAYYIRRQYCARERQNILASYQNMNVENPSAEMAEDIFADLKAKEDLVMDKSWESYVVDPFDIRNNPEDTAVVFRNGEPFFWRGNIYLVSGYAGVMKSFLCLIIAAAVINRGTNADKTLSFHTFDSRLKVLFADTELAMNTINVRQAVLRRLTGENLDRDFFKYLSLSGVPGGVQGKLNIFDKSCRDFKPDVIIVDSARDFCCDFNDNRETDVLVMHLKQLVTRLNAVLISTCHRTIGTGNAKGHFGTRFNEEAGMEMQLTKSKASGYIEVEFPKQRESNFEPFSFRYDEETGSIVECTPTVDRSERSRQERAAEDAVRLVLKPGEKIRYNELLHRLTGQLRISETTAKAYIRALTGTVLNRTENGDYFLSDGVDSFPFKDDLPEV